MGEHLNSCIQAGSGNYMRREELGKAAGQPQVWGNQKCGTEHPGRSWKRGSTGRWEF